MAPDKGRYRSAESKNPSGLLISVIRTLSSIDDVQVRETEKGRLEEEFEKCDRDLDVQIIQHYAELTSTIKTYQSITERISSSHNKVKQVKESLLSCKTLLLCKRDELKKLWIESIEHKHVLQLLDEIESIKLVPQRLEAYMTSKHYLNATDMLVSAVESLEGPLLQVKGLGDLRQELHSKKLNIHMVLIDELHKHLYIKSTSHLVHKNKDKNAARLPGNVCEMQQEIQDNNQTALHEIHPEDNSAEFMGILVKALVKLKKIPETINTITERLEPELKQILKRSTIQIVEHSDQRGDTVTQENQPRLLLELLELLFDKFKAVALAHSVVLAHLHQIMVQCPGGAHEDIMLYELSDVSAKIQIVLQGLLKDYLDVKNSRSNSNGFSPFFGKKRNLRAKLFKFESSSLTIRTREQKRELYSKCEEIQGGADDNLIEEEINFVSKPGARNITVIFQPLLRFIQEIELMSCDLGPGQAKQCQLRNFLTYYMNIFLNQVQTEINKEMGAVSTAVDPLKILASIDTMKVLGVQRPLLQSTVVVEKSIQDLVSLMQNLSAYSNQFLEIVCDKLKEYKHICNTAYRGIVQCEGKLTISAFWSTDEDIRLLLQSLPNWVNMTQPKQTQQKKDEELTRVSLVEEADVLTCNLADKLIAQNEFLHDVRDLKALANLHESMEWISGRIKMLSTLNHTTSVSPDHANQVYSENECSREHFLQTLSDLSRGFQDIADCCLLVLHLEVRIHCFHFLIPMVKQGNYDIMANVQSMDYDPLVAKLNKDISAIGEAMSAALQQQKFRYIFEGLGSLISCILINGAQHFKRISESGINKMCRNIAVLQQNLTNTTMTREADLDFAKQYYEMLYNTADEMLNLVVDQGVRYTEQEYINALLLLHRSQMGVGDLSTQNIRLQQLKDIICEQAAIEQVTKDKNDQWVSLSRRCLPSQRKSFSSKARSFLSKIATPGEGIRKTFNLHTGARDHQID